MAGTPALSYLRDPAKITAESFAIIRDEANSAGLPPDIAAIAVRLMHASGMTDLPADLKFDPAIANAALTALRQGAAIFTDSEMVAKAINPRRLPAANQIICTLNDHSVPPLARQLGTTRSAAAVSLWRERLAGAIAVIGNAPTALFALLEGIDAGWPKPRAIIGLPVGFIGASEAKQKLARNPRGIPFITLLGRRGGSAMAGAAVNAITATATDEVP